MDVGHTWRTSATVLVGILPGVSALDAALDGIIGSSVAALLMIILIVVVAALLCFRYPGPPKLQKSRNRKTPKPKYDLNGNAPNGIPMQTRIPNGIHASPKGTHRGVPMGSHRGPPPGALRFTPFAGPGAYRSMMHPYFLRPPYQQIIYIDESDEDEHSVRSTMRERKKRYTRSFYSTHEKPSPSKVEIKSKGKKRQAIEQHSSNLQSSSKASERTDPNIDRKIEQQIDKKENEQNIDTQNSVSPKLRQKSDRKTTESDNGVKQELNSEQGKTEVSDSGSDAIKVEWEVESAEEQMKLSDEETKSPEKSRSRSPEKKSVHKTRSRSRSPALDLSPRHSGRPDSTRSTDEIKQIDDMFNFAAEPTPGDVIFQEASSSPVPTTPREVYVPESPKRLTDEPPSNIYAAVIKPTEPLRESVRNSAADSEMYASVIKPGTSVNYNGDRSNPLRQSMSDRLEEIVQNRREGKPTEFDRNEDDVNENQDVSGYPQKAYSLSQSERHDISARKEEFGFSQRQNLSKSSRYPSNDDYTLNRDYTNVDRPLTPPVDIPSETTSPRESFMRKSSHSNRPTTPPFDAVVTPRSSTIERPVTPPFDAETDGSTKETRQTVPPPAPLPLTGAGGVPNIKAAFSNQVLRELQQRQRGASIGDEVDDEDNARAVNFSAAPPEIIPRSEPNSPRTSMNIPQTGIPPAPPPPPPPPPPPLPK